MDVHQKAIERASRKPNPPPPKWDRYLASGSYRRLGEPVRYEVRDEHAAELVRRNNVGRFV